MNIILGSGSASRKRILRKMGYDFEVMMANIDERAIRHEDPVALTMLLAKAKAKALLPRIQKPALLITADQVVRCNNEIFEKPENAKEVRRHLKKYSNYPAEVINALVVTNTKTQKQAEGTSIAWTYFRSIPKEVVQSAIQDGTVFSRAGSFSVEDPIFEPYVARIVGTVDEIEGLSKELTKRLLKEAQA